VKAVDIKFSGIFATTPRLEIPLFQRPYVWEEQKNWLPLWLDIRKATEQVEQEELGSTAFDEAPTYFLGAVVLQERAYRPKRIRSSFIIDGQQRLTTMMVFLAAARAVATGCGAEDLEAKFQDFVECPSKHVYKDYPEDKYRVWPLPQDRPAFKWAVRPPTSSTAMPIKDNGIARARRWFEDALKVWTSEVSDPRSRLEALHFAVDDRLQFVQIILEKSDDPQVIFEALNHRGVPLDAADLVKNLLFQELEIQGKGAMADQLLMEQWLPLDSDEWRLNVTSGRIKRVQVDLLLSYFLTIATGQEVLVEHLFADFKAWLHETQTDAADVIANIRHHANEYQAIKKLPLTTGTGQLIDRLEATQTTTPWPTLLFLQATEVPQSQRELAARAIDSFLMRRNVCGLTTKDYNRLFLSVLNAARTASPHHAGQAVVNCLEAQTADSRYWPDDDEFAQSLESEGLYKRVVRARLKCLLVGLENHLRTEKSEYSQPLSARNVSLNIEHLMPQSWEKTWPLVDASDADMQLRHNMLHRLGNLTVTTTKMNPSLSNKPWSEKVKAIQKHSLARLTTGSVLSPPESATADLDGTWAAVWDERRIVVRGSYLAKAALEAWPRLPWVHVPKGEGGEAGEATGDE